MNGNRIMYKCVTNSCNIYICLTRRFYTEQYTLDVNSFHLSADVYCAQYTPVNVSRDQKNLKKKILVSRRLYVYVQL